MRVLCYDSVPLPMSLYLLFNRKSVWNGNDLLHGSALRLQKENPVRPGISYYNELLYSMGSGLPKRFHVELTVVMGSLCMRKQIYPVNFIILLHSPSSSGPACIFRAVMITFPAQEPSVFSDAGLWSFSKNHFSGCLRIWASLRHSRTSLCSSKELLFFWSELVGWLRVVVRLPLNCSLIDEVCKERVKDCKWGVSQRVGRADTRTVADRNPGQRGFCASYYSLFSSLQLLLLLIWCHESMPRSRTLQHFCTNN